MAKEFMGEHSLRMLTQLIKGVMVTHVAKSDIVSDFDSEDTDKALSAKAGKELKDMIEGLGDSDEYIEAYAKPGTNPPDFYEDNQYQNLITGSKGKIYMDLNTNDLYRFDGTEFVFMGMSEMTDKQVQDLWNDIMGNDQEPDTGE